MIIHCTKKLIKKLPQAEPIVADTAHPLGSWHANLHIVDRRQCVLFCHDKTRFALFSAGLKKHDLENLAYIFIDLFVNTLLKLGYDTALIESAAQFMQETTISFDSTCDRSVLSTMNLVFRQEVYHELMKVNNVMDLLPYSPSARLNDRPTRVKGMKRSECLWPADEMRRLLSGLVVGSKSLRVH